MEAKPSIGAQSDGAQGLARYQQLTDSGGDWLALWLDDDTIFFARSSAKQPGTGVVRLSSGKTTFTPLTLPEGAMDTDWSPRFNYLVFRRAENKKLTEWSYWLYERSTGKLTQLLKDKEDITMVWEFRWTADERALITIMTQKAEFEGIPLGPLGPRFLGWIDLQSGQVTKLTDLPRSALFLTLSPKGDQAVIALSNNRNSPNDFPFLKFSFGRSELQQLTVSGGGWVKWSPDGSRIAYLTKETSGGATGEAVWAARSNGEDAKRVSDQGYNDGNLTAYQSGYVWMADSRRLLFKDYSLMDVNSGATSQLQFQPDQSSPMNPKALGPLSPDGKKVPVFSDKGIGVVALGK